MSTRTVHEVFDSTDEPNAGCTHFDREVWPDDIDWYRLLERHVDFGSSVVRVHRLSEGESSESEASATLVLLRRSGMSRRSRLQAMQNYYTSDFRPLCSAREAYGLIPELVDRIVRTERAVAIELGPLDPDTRETEILRDAFRRIGWRAGLDVAFANWVHDVEGSFADYLRCRPSRVVNTLRRKRRALLALPGARVHVHDGTAGDLAALIADYRRVYARSWKVPEPHADFVPALIAEQARRGRLRIGFVSLGDEPVAVHFWIVKGGCASIYKLAHDDAYDRYSPGTVLLAAMLEHAIDRDGVTRLDFLSGDDAYKRDWMSERREKLVLRARDPRSIGALTAFLREAHAAPFAARVRRLAGHVASVRKGSR